MMETAIVIALVFLLSSQAGGSNFVTRKDVPTRNFNNGNRIISGSEAKLGQFPWQVAILYRSSSGGVYLCGGALVSPRYVITTASCAYTAELFFLNFGDTRLEFDSPGAQSIAVNGSEAVIHPDYNPENFNYDLALIKLSEALEETETIKPIRIPQRGEIIAVGSNLTVSGWGVTEASPSLVQDLLYTHVNAISNLQCAAVYGSSVVIESTVCTQGNPLDSPCSGDTGGPLVSYHGADPTLVGVVSFIHREGCTSGNPAGYVRIEPLVGFINEVISGSG